MHTIKQEALRWQSARAATLAAECTCTSDVAKQKKQAAGSTLELIRAVCQPSADRDPAAWQIIKVGGVPVHSTQHGG